MADDVYETLYFANQTILLVAQFDLSNANFVGHSNLNLWGRFLIDIIYLDCESDKDSGSMLPSIPHHVLNEYTVAILLEWIVI